MFIIKENSNPVEMALRKASITAGIGLLLMAILAPIANFSALQNLIVHGDYAATFSKITASVGLFRLAICFFLIVSILDIVVAWALYDLFKLVNKRLSLLSAWFRIVYAAIFAFSLNNLFHVLQLLSGADYLKAFEANQLKAQVMLNLEMFQSGWNTGMVIFGLHLLVLGYLVFKSKYFPKFLGILVIVAGIGYLIDSLGKLFLPDYKMTIAMFTFIGELLLMFWLFWKGIKGFGKNSINIIE
jgi:hypothetical protein